MRETTHSGPDDESVSQALGKRVRVRRERGRDIQPSCQTLVNAKQQARCGAVPVEADSSEIDPPEMAEDDSGYGTSIIQADG